MSGRTPLLLAGLAMTALLLQLALPPADPTLLVRHASRRAPAASISPAGALPPSPPPTPDLDRRPLFTDPGSATGPVAPESDALALVGTVQVGPRSSVLIRDAAGVTHATGLGGVVQGWTVLRVSGEAVELGRGAERRRLDLAGPVVPSNRTSP